jgi:hypothetical protein
MSGIAMSAARAPTVLIRGRRYPVVLPSVRDPRLHLAAVIVSLQVLGQTAFAFRLSIAQILISLLTCAVLEVGIVFWRQRVVMWPASALLTGNGIAFILRVPDTRHGDWWSVRGAWIFAATAAVGILSKYVLRFGDRHVFNPSNFALVICFLLLGSTRAEPLDFWWGPMSTWLALTIGIIVIGGLAILARLRLLGIAIGFWLAFAAGLAVLAASGHSMTARWHLGPISNWSFWWILVSSPEILVFLFFMITDPRTVPERPVQRWVYAVAVGFAAALLIAPQRTEFGSKVAVLGALALVCAGSRLIAWLLQVRGWRSHGGGGWRRVRVAALTLTAVGAYASVLVAAGIPARSHGAPTLAAIEASSGVARADLLQVTIAPSRDVASKIDRRVAVQIARDVVADLRFQTDALQRRDLKRAAVGAAGAWLRALQRRIHAAEDGKPIVVPTYHVERLRVGLAAGPGQDEAKILVTLQGTVERSTYAGSPPQLDRPAALAGVRQTFEVAARGSRYLIVASRRETSAAPAGEEAASAAGGASGLAVDVLSRQGGSAPQGLPFVLRVLVHNARSTSVPVDVGLRLSGAGAAPVTFFRHTILVPANGHVLRSVAVTPSQWFRSTGSYRIDASVDGGPSGRALVLDVTKPRVAVPIFEDVTRRSGLVTSMPAPACGRWAAGAAWADVNGDGQLDLFVPRRDRPSQLWINDGHGHFRDEAALRGAAQAGPSPTGASFVDYDNDGHPDLFVFGDGGNRLFHNDGTGRFNDVTAGSGLESTNNATSAAWADYDGDGRLDVFVTDYGHCGAHGIDESFVYGTGRLFHNDGNGHFSDVTRLLGPGTTIGAGFQSAWIDLEGNGRPDLYLGNDYVGPHPRGNRFWRNGGPGRSGWRFTDESRASGLALHIDTMGIAVGDYDRDLELDLALPDLKRNWLLRNHGDGTFGDVSAAAGITGAPNLSTDVATESRITWGAGFYDLNLDGWEDLYFAAGSMEEPVASPNQLFINSGNGTFANLSAPSRADDPSASRGVAFADYDNDGRVDMYVLNEARMPFEQALPHLFRNVTPYRGNHWLEVDTIGTVSNRDGCGARLIVSLKGAPLLRQVMCGSTSLASWSDKRVHYGLGRATRIAKLVIDWPSGIRQEFRNLPVDRVVKVVEPRRASH